MHLFNHGLGYTSDRTDHNRNQGVEYVGHYRISISWFLVIGCWFLVSSVASANLENQLRTTNN